MFHRDPSAEEDLTSEQTFAWPPSGFRDRRSHFGRPTDPTATASASASSTSSPFGQHHNTAQRKSSDQVIQSLRDELDKHRQMFFDRLAPQWESSAQRTGFPFTDTARRAFSGIDRTVPPPYHANYAFHQDDIPAWMTEDDADLASSFGRASAGSRQRWPSGGSGRSAGSNSSAGSGGPTSENTRPTTTAPSDLDSAQHSKMGRSDSPSTRTRMPKPAARSATGDFPPVSPAASPKSGFCRASSAPPVAPHADSENNASVGSPRRLFTTTVPQAANNPASNQRENIQMTDSPGLGRRSIHHHHNSSGGSGNNVRHIPIMVEGRDEPLLPSVAEEGGQFTDAEKRSKTAIPMPFYPTAEKTVPVTQIPISVSNPMAEKPSKTEKLVKVEQKEEVRDGSVPIPLPYDRLSDDSGKSAGSSTSVGIQTANDLELIDRIQRETESLLPRIEEFRGDRHDRGFLFLDEMLTRLLLKLDNVQVEGRDDVRSARRQAIASITRCINLLESKLLNGIERSNEGEVATADNAPPQPDEPMEENCTDAKVEEQQTDIEMADANPVPPSPTRHVTQLMINISQPTCADAEKTNDAPADPVQ
ncbi:BAG domain-containing protein Samui isoform X1 [Daphnia magna]|uniref:BAG domain-containing protein Samui isoform X1 n=1 Tax=Daphnia magna TaxID=35525 RepID=UPI001E1BB9A0|nr:BAG domain-containing protein Samui isoform X1 [Daphnia magna]